MHAWISIDNDKKTINIVNNGIRVEVFEVGDIYLETPDDRVLDIDTLLHSGR